MQDSLKLLYINVSMSAKEGTKIEDKTISSEAKDKKEDKVLVSYKGEWYDVTAFDHPGEGAGVYLSDYNGKEIDDELENAHMTDEPMCILAEAKKKKDTGFHGIKYIGKITS